MGWSPRGSSCDADVDQGREGRYDGDGDESRYRTDAVRASRKRVRRLRRSKLARAPIADEEESTSAVGGERERERESKAREKARAGEGMVWAGERAQNEARPNRAFATSRRTALDTAVPFAHPITCSPTHAG